MFRSRLASVGLRAGGPHREGLPHRAAVNYAGARRRHASSATTEITGDNVRQKTIDDLGGPSFLSTLNWLFVKGFLPKTQQMQVSGTRTLPCAACVRAWRFVHGALLIYLFMFCTLVARIRGVICAITNTAQFPLFSPNFTFNSRRGFDLDVI